MEVKISQPKAVNRAVFGQIFFEKRQVDFFIYITKKKLSQPWCQKVGPHLVFVEVL